ncbi:MAG: Transglutaminase-like enzyme [Thermodesulfobacteria bacterium]|nr:DUF3488 and transglutaminase-like domain-containing protein [Thermodesulfobacteriota bacterium]MCU4138943.1 Transglutaminase-like enzyme [Thermodesulfobacteriota bacterium]
MNKKEKNYKVETAVKIFTYSAGFIAFIILFGKISYFYYSASFILFLVSIYLEYKKIHIKRTFINIFAILLVILKFYNVSLETILQPALEVLLFLLSLKFLEDKKFRDYMEIYLLSVLILAGSTLISFDIIFLVYLLLYILILNISIILLTYYSQDKEIILSEETLIKLFLKTSIIPLLAIPFTVLFFIILPRTDFPIFGFLNKEAKAKTGFSENVRLGEVSNIQEDDTVIFRAKMRKVREDFLYWRGIVLDFFNGKTWISLKHKRIEGETILKGIPIMQIIYLEPYGDRYLFGLDKPYKIDYSSGLPHLLKKTEFTFFLSTPVISRIKYKVFSVLTDTIPQKYINKNLYLQLPKNLSPKIKTLAIKLKKETDEETANQILKFLKYGEYKYSLKNLPISKNPLEEFLFKYKYGNCEYFASSMAVLLRINGIPARLVAGYKGGIYNNVGKYYLIRQSNAHVWVEAFIKGKGWVRYDPTPSLSYQLTNRKSLSKIELIFETINYYYINFVLNYDLKKQVALVRSVSKLAKIPNFKLFIDKKKTLYFVSFVLLISLAGVLGFKYFLNVKRLKDEEKLMKEFLKILEEKGYKKKETEGLEEFVSKIKDKKLKVEALNFVKIFEKIYYKDKPFTKERLNELKNIINRIKYFSKKT